MNFKVLLVTCFVFTACSKSKTEDKPDEGSSLRTGVYRVENLVADTTATSAGNAVSMYYSLEENKVIPESQRQTGRWDIVFYGIYNSSVYPNNGASIGSPSFGGPGNARIYVVVDRKFDAQFYDTINFKPKNLPIPRALFNAAFDAVKTADDSKLGIRDIGLDHFQGETDGWGYYDFYGALFPGNAKKSHIVYTMPRVMIVKTHKGHYA